MMSTSKIRLGFVGLGGIAGAHLNGLRILRQSGFDFFEVTALCSRNRDNAERWVERGQGPSPLPPMSPHPSDPLNIRDVHVRDFQDNPPRLYTDHRDMLRDRAVDAVVLLSAPSAHYPVAADALEHGVHVFIEKPFTVTARAARRLIEKAEARRLTLGVAEDLRYFESTRAGAWAIRSGLLGDVQMVVHGGVGGVWSPDRIVATTPWRHLKAEAGGGGTMDIGAHLFDWLRYHCGEIEEVTALARALEPVRYNRDAAGRVTGQVACEVDDTFFALLQFASGAIGNLLFSWAGRGAETHLDGGGAIYGSRGCLKGGRLLIDDQPAVDATQAFTERAGRDVLARCFPRGIRDAFALELLEFLSAVAEGRQPETSGVEGLKDIAPGLAILESSLAGMPVKLADVEACRIERYQVDINRHWGIE